MEKERKYYIRTFGCQMNFHDSEKMAGMLSEGGMREASTEQDAGVVIFNTCSIRQKAEQKFLSELGRLKKLKKRNPGLKIAVAGCIAQQMGAELFKKAPHVDFVIGPQNIHLIRGLVEGEEAGAAHLEANPDLARSDLPVQRNGKPSAWVNVMYGCNNFCTYCIVPYTRGREVSRPSENILREIEGLAARGIKEVNLLGQNVNSYHGDTGFSGLLGKVNGIPAIERIRFVTSHPRDLSDGLIQAMKSLGKVCEHIHLPLQSGSNSVLGGMNRKYTYESYLEKIEKLRAAMPGIAITTDIITGFPGETEEDHGMTLRALREIEYDGIFAFMYSPRPGTRAARMDGQLPDVVKSARLSGILSLQDEMTLKKNKALEGSLQEILVEGPSEKGAPGQYTGRTRGNKIVNFDSDKDLTGHILKVNIKSAGIHSLKGELI